MKPPCGHIRISGCGTDRFLYRLLSDANDVGVLFTKKCKLDSKISFDLVIIKVWKALFEKKVGQSLHSYAFNQMKRSLSKQKNEELRVNLNSRLINSQRWHLCRWKIVLFIPTLRGLSCLVFKVIPITFLPMPSNFFGNDSNHVMRVSCSSSDLVNLDGIFF